MPSPTAAPASGQYRSSAPEEDIPEKSGSASPVGLCLRRRDLGRSIFSLIRPGMMLDDGAELVLSGPQMSGPDSAGWDRGAARALVLCG